MNTPQEQVKSIQTGGSEQAQAYQMLVEQLGMYLKDLKNLESTNPVEDAQRVLSNLHTFQEHERKEVEEQIVEQARHRNDSGANYQNLIDD